MLLPAALPGRGRGSPSSGGDLRPLPDVRGCAGSVPQCLVRFGIGNIHKPATEFGFLDQLNFDVNYKHTTCRSEDSILW